MAKFKKKKTEKIDDERFIVRTQEESKERWAKFKKEHPERFGD